MAAGQLLLMTGSPGGGKTTVAPLVADHAPRSACFELDWFFATLRSSAMEPWREEAHEQNRAVLASAAAAVATLSSRGYLTVAAGILYPFMLDLFEEACAPLDVTVHYAVMRAPLDVVQERVASRTTEPEHLGALADAGVVSDLWAIFERAGIAERHRVDVAQQSPAAIAGEVYRRYGNGDFRL